MLSVLVVFGAHLFQNFRFFFLPLLVHSGGGSVWSFMDNVLVINEECSCSVRELGKKVAWCFILKMD